MGTVTIRIADAEGNFVDIPVPYAIAATPPPPPPAPKILLAAASVPRSGESISSMQAFQRLAAAVKGGGGTMPMRHTYSGTTIPSFDATDINAKLLTMVNVKTPGMDYAGALLGHYDAQWKAFLDGWLAAINSSGMQLTYHGELVIDHEPEQPGKNGGVENRDADVFRRCFARWVGLFLAHPLSKYVTFNYVGMAFSYTQAALDKGRQMALWDPWPLMTASQQAMVRYATDLYFTSNSSADANWSFNAQPYLTYSAGRRRAIFECAVNNNSGQSDATVSALLTALAPKLKSAGFETIAYYESPGPAAGTSPWIDTPAKAAGLATWST